MDNPELWIKFSEYLDSANRGMTTSKRGLVPNAPQEAIDAYEQFKKDEKERIASGDDGE